MCYYARTDYRCGDWRWGNMKLRCPRQHRMGEVCGAKLVDTENVTRIDDDCRLCQEIMVKERRLQKERDNINRWSREGNKFLALIEKAQREAKSLEEMIAEMVSRRPSVVVKNNYLARVGSGNSSMSGTGGMSASPYPTTPYGSHGHSGYSNGDIARHQTTSSRNSGSYPSTGSYSSAYPSPHYHSHSRQ